MSLRARLLTGMVAIAAVLAVAAVFIARTTEQHLLQQVDAQLSRADTNIGGPGPGFGDGARSDDHLSSIYIGGFDATTNALVTLRTAGLAGDAPPTPAITLAQAIKSEKAHAPFTVGSRGGGVDYRVLARNDRVGLIVLAIPLSDVNSAVGRLIAVEVAATLAVLAVLALVTWWVIRLGVRPIKQMTLTASAIAGGELSHRVPDVAAGTEAGELGLALNQMLGRIEEAFDDRTRSEDRLKQFVADASHELRTPITTIRGYAELYRSGGLREGDDLAEALRRTEQESI
ncbi:MAG: two-component system, OmpR family, sensor kinase, partial [Actinomycetota bacterium]|nr:two-component system, OmpR family, sensor kinase [Actinomycetota bacterium]